MPTEAKKPDGWEKLSREGSREGAECGWCPHHRKFYQVTAGGSIVWHEMPEGFRYDSAAGQLVAVETAAAKGEAAPAVPKE